MHIDHLPVSLLPINYRRHQHQCILGDKIPYASLILVVVASVCFQVEFERPREREDQEEG